MKLQMQRYYGLYEKWKRKAVGKEKKEAQKLYASKGRGQWHLMKQMANQGQTKPLIALKRRKKGKRGQPIGSITMEPTEIDEIIREAYGKIYDGNAKDQQTLMD